MTSSTKNSGSGADSAAVGTLAWTNPNFAVGAADGSYALATLNTASTVVSHYLKTTNFGFSVPNNATINGIQVDFHENSTIFTPSTDYIVDSEVKIIKSDSSLGTTNKANASHWAANVGGFTVSYGGSSDLWGETWSPTDINSSSFGAAISVSITEGSNGLSAGMDTVVITVYYTTPPDLTANVSDSVTFSESVQTLQTTLLVNVPLSVSDNLALNESIIPAIVPLFVNVADLMTLNESLNRSDPVPKSYMYKVYDSTGTTLLKTWTDVTTEPAFSQDINLGGSQMVLFLARAADNFGEAADVDFGLQVQVSVIDTDAPNGAIMFIGYIADYKPVFGDNEGVEITLLGYGAELDSYLLDDNTTTKFTYNSQDPGTILRDVIDKYRTLGGTLNYSTSTVELTGTLVSYTFNTNTILECIQKCLELAPASWYWYVDQATNLIHFHPSATSSAYNFTLGKDIYNLSSQKRTEDIVNAVYFTGTGVYSKFKDQNSINTYKMHALRINDQRVTLQATAATIATTVINSRKNPEVRLDGRILDNNSVANANDGFNIESIKVGDVFNLRNIGGQSGSVTTDLTLINFQILRIEYKPSAVRFVSSSILPDVAKRIEDILRALTQSLTSGNPANPVINGLLAQSDSVTFTESISLTVV